MFFYLYKVLFSGFLQFNGNFVDAENNSNILSSIDGLEKYDSSTNYKLCKKVKSWHISVML